MHWDPNTFEASFRRLGFLVDISPDHIQENLENIFKGNYSVDERISLEGTVLRNGKEISKNISFNDVVIHSRDAVRMMEMDTMLDGENFIQSMLMV